LKGPARFKLVTNGTFQPNSADDPLPYYYKPFVGNIYRYRIQQGLSLLSPPYNTILEFGYGSGLLLPTLAAISNELYGVDIESNPDAVKSYLTKLNINAQLFKGDLSELQFPDSTFDLVVAFSVFEHIKDCRKIAREMIRILKPDGRLLVGIPRVDATMTRLFQLIGYDKIEQHHVTDHNSFLNACRGYFVLDKQARLFPFLPSGLGLYFNMLLKKENLRFV
jgi:SAM-dependent methyltransferase